MKNFILFIGILVSLNSIYSQEEVYSFISKENNSINRVISDDNYVVLTSYTAESSKFLKTIGGYYKKEGNKFIIDLEFNSNYKNDSISNYELLMNDSWNKISLKKNDLNGKWLMAGRVRNGKEQRRSLDRSRKTMKFLINGYFQWIAFNTETFQFSGSGGGTYETKNGNYMETIEYFSRDDSRVGLNLKFNYDIINKEWNHMGLSSKGDPIHEIWVNRK